VFIVKRENRFSVGEISGSETVWNLFDLAGSFHHWQDPITVLVWVLWSSSRCHHHDRVGGESEQGAVVFSFATNTSPAYDTWKMNRTQGVQEPTLIQVDPKWYYGDRITSVSNTL
jgi:hypothetical protein